MILQIKVKPHSENQNIIKISETEYKISLKSSPEENKTNIELIKLLAKELNISSKNINIIKGLKSREKIVQISKD